MCFSRSFEWLSPLLAILFFVAGPARAEGSWPLFAQGLMAADAAFYAPPDLKRQITRHRTQLMAGVSDGVLADRLDRTPAERRAALIRATAAVADGIRNHMSFSRVAYEAGGLIHETAMLYPPPQETSAEEIRNTSQKGVVFLGFPVSPFGNPKALFFGGAGPSTVRMAYDQCVTVGTRLLTWIWHEVGGNTSIALQYPDSKGPYRVRE